MEKCTRRWNDGKCMVGMTEKLEFLREGGKIQ